MVCVQAEADMDVDMDTGDKEEEKEEEEPVRDLLQHSRFRASLTRCASCVL